MVIVCEKCDTRFQLDDSRVPAKGVRVRCSRCQHAFFVTPPGCAQAGRGERVEAEVANAAPMPAQDRAEEHGFGDFEEDWQFNEDSDPELEPEPHLEADRSGFDAFDTSGFDLAEEPSELETGGVADGLGEAEPESPAAGEPLIDAVESILARDAEPDSSSTEDLGSPEEWDFVGEGEVGLPIAPHPEEDSLEPDAPASDDESSFSPTRAESSTAAPKAREEPGDVFLAARLPHLASRAGWVLVVFAFAAGISTVVLPRDPGSAVSRSPAEVAVSNLALTATEVEGRVIENALAGDLLVVSGMLANQGGEALGPGHVVWVHLVSADGTPIAGASAAAGAALTERMLREQDPDRLRAHLERSAAEMAQRPLRPRERFRFDAVFESIPETAAGWVLEAATAPPHRGPENPSLPLTAPLSWE